MPTGLSTALKMTSINLSLLVLFYFVLGFDNLPSRAPFFWLFIMTIIMGGLIPAYFGGYVFKIFSRKGAGKEMTIFAVLAITLALLNTIPNGNNNATSDMYFITTALHFSTAISGIWFIPRGINLESPDA
jgi:hypothetical protein